MSPPMVATHLDVDMYAESADAASGSWVLLAKATGKGKGKANVVSNGVDAQAAKILKGLSPEMRAALQAQLDAQ